MKTMRNLFIVFLSFTLIGGLSAQEKRASPLMSAKQNLDGVNVSIDYGQPSKKGRDIFGALVPYGKVWRTGANEATVLEVSETVSINGSELKAGKYALFTIPGEKEWTVILNSVWNQWGAYNYDASKDVLSFKVPVETKKKSMEKFTISISKKGLVEMYWDTTGIEFKIEKA